MRRLGIDIGSVSVGTALLEDNVVLHSSYTAHKGEIHNYLRERISEYMSMGFETLGITSSIFPVSEHIIDPVLSVIEGAKFCAPESANVFVIGGERYYLIFFDDKGDYIAHSENPACASGTGSFIEQQAERLSLSVPQLAEKAGFYNGKVPRIATRCAVFAKSDIIHAMQEGFSTDAIAAGLCKGIARNVTDVLMKGQELHSPVAVLGGVSQNGNIVAALEQIIDKKVIVPDTAPLAGALGAALLGSEITQNPLSTIPVGIKTGRRRGLLSVSPVAIKDADKWQTLEKDGVELFFRPEMINNGLYQFPGTCALGIDIGSTSTKAVVTDTGGVLYAGFYTRTQGDPIAAVEKLISSLRSFSGGVLPDIFAAATTGSGRKIIGTLFCADTEINEITAHARAAHTLFPGVDTIIEIGGQDSKYTRLTEGEVATFQMNYVCAAGTGSFIEEQARKLDISLGEMSDLAMQGQAPYTSDRCTVYMERDLAVLLGEGWAKKDLAAAVIFSVRDNYIARVAGKAGFGKKTVFQGATARNSALVKAFEEYLGQPVYVAACCHLTGALGAALAGIEYQKHSDNKKSRFTMELRQEMIEREECSRCVNHCSLLVVGQGLEKTAWGMKCGRDYSSRKPGAVHESSRVAARNAAAFMIRNGQEKHCEPRAQVRLLGGLYGKLYNPLWKRFFIKLGCSVAEVESTEQILACGKQIVNADFCLPMILAHGQIAWAINHTPDIVFCPAIINEHDDRDDAVRFREKKTDRYFCYYSEYFPTLAGNLTGLHTKNRLGSPLISFHHQTKEEIADELYASLDKLIPGLSQAVVRKAYADAYEEYREARACYRKCLDIPEAGALRIVLLGRPYIVFDVILGKQITGELERMGAEVVWQDELDMTEMEYRITQKYRENMHWYFGLQVLDACEYIVRTPNTYGIYLSCFRCSPDSFLLSYTAEIMKEAGKPMLTLTLDELSSRVGYITRIEAAFNAFRTHSLRTRTDRKLQKNEQDDRLAPGDTVLVPYLNQLIGHFWAESFRNAGFRAEVLDNNEHTLATGYAYSNGGECMPAVAIVGGMIEKMKELRLNPEKTALYLPTLCIACNFPQFPILARLARDEAGFFGLKIAIVNSMLQGEALPGQLSMKLFEGGVLSSLLYKLYYRIKPYETHTGASDRALETAEELVGQAFLKGQDVRQAFSEAADCFRQIMTDRSLRIKPRIAVLGDFYVKYNETVNQHLDALIMELGGEVVIPSFTEMTFHFFDVDVRQNDASDRPMKMLKMFESRYEKMVADIVGEYSEPEWRLCVEALEEYGIEHYIPGETTLNLSRALYYIKNKSVDAIVHINPIFCCPGVVSSSIFKKISCDSRVPIIDIFYDGTGNPNKVLIPYIHYLKEAIDKAKA